MFASQQTEETEPEGETQRKNNAELHRNIHRKPKEKSLREEEQGWESSYRKQALGKLCGAQRKEPWTSSTESTSQEYGNYFPIWICGLYNFTQYSGQLWGGVTWISEREALRRIIDSLTELIPWVAALIKIVWLWGWGRTHAKGWSGRGLHKTVTPMS